jgi:hypothetical protein
MICPSTVFPRVATLAALLSVAGCTNGRPPAAPPTSASSTAVAGSTGLSTSTTRPPRTAPPAVNVAVIIELTPDSVTWVDGKKVPAPTKNWTIVRLSGAAHQHTAPLSPDIAYFVPQGPDGLALGQDALGTVPSDRGAMSAWVVGNDLAAARLMFDAQGRVQTMAARWHP